MRTIAAWMALSLLVACAAEPPLQLDLGAGVKMELLRVEPGSFTQGSPETEAGRGADETQRQVTISQPFYLGRFPVTRGQWERFAKEKGYQTEAEKGTSGGYGWDGQSLKQGKEYNWKFPGFAQGENDPVTLVTWNDAKEYLRWLSAKTGRICVLPTEAQWEYACRAGTTTAWPVGDETESAGAWAWFLDNSSGRTHQVGMKQPNAWGFHDMGGQVWEWCQDWYAPYENTAVADPLQTNDRLSDKPRRVLRGGSFLKGAASTRSAARYRNDARSRNADNGFRVMVLVDQATTEVPRLPQIAASESEEPVLAHAPDIRLNPPATVTDQTRSLHSSKTSKLGIMVVVGGVILALIVRFMRKGSNGSSPPRLFSGSGGRLEVKSQDDGFWVKGGLPPGAMIEWRYLVKGERKEGRVAYQPGPEGMFIFTGTRPQQAEAWPVADAGFTSGPPDLPLADGRNQAYAQGAAAGMIVEQLHRNDGRSTPPPLRHDSPSSTPHRGFPSAY